MVLVSLSERFGDWSIAFFHLIRLKGPQVPGRRCTSISLIEANPVPEQHKARSRHPVLGKVRVHTKPGVVRSTQNGTKLDGVLYWECGFRHVGIGGGRASRQQLLIFDLDGSRVIIGAVGKPLKWMSGFERKRRHRADLAKRNKAHVWRPALISADPYCASGSL